MAKKGKPTHKESPIWFKLLAVLFGVLPLIWGIFFLIAGQLNVANFVRFFSPIIVLVAGYLILKSVRKNVLSNWDYLLLIVLLVLAFVLL